jgi:hypothetical protein
MTIFTPAKDIHEFLVYSFSRCTLFLNRGSTMTHGSVNAWNNALKRIGACFPPPCVIFTWMTGRSTCLARHLDAPRNTWRSPKGPWLGGILLGPMGRKESGMARLQEWRHGKLAIVVEGVVCRMSGCWTWTTFKDGAWRTMPLNACL